VIPPGPDTDLGPWCRNFTSGDKLFHTSSETLRPIYNYPMPNSTCGTDPGCLMPGCVQFRETTYKSGQQQWLGCSIVFPWWYGAGPSGNRTSLPCPLFDPDISTFTFRGGVYYNFMANYGHPYGAEDCHRNIMCSPSSLYFDTTQHSTLKWCQPTPPGFYSPQCNNTLLPCTTSVSMNLRYFYTHGMGVQTGCGIRSTAPATLSVYRPSFLMDPTFYLSAVITLEPLWNAPNPSGKPTILFGLFPQYYLGMLPVTEGVSRIALYHRNWTVTVQQAFIQTPPVLMTTSVPHSVAVQGDGTVITFWVDSSLVFTTAQDPSSATMGSLNMSGLPQMYTNGSLLHLGYFLANLTGDFINSTTLVNPYSSTDTFTAITISNVSVSSSIYMTTTTSSTDSPFSVSSLTQPQLANNSMDSLTTSITSDSTSSTVSTSSVIPTSSTTTSTTEQTRFSSAVTPSSSTIGDTSEIATTPLTSVETNTISATTGEYPTTDSVTTRTPQQDQKDPKLVVTSVPFTSPNDAKMTELIQSSEWSITNPDSPLMWIISGCIGFGVLFSVCYCAVRYKFDRSMGLTERGRRSVLRVGSSPLLPPPTEIVVAQ